MKFDIVNGLPFICFNLRHQGQLVSIEHALIDTGSAATIISADYLDTFGITPEHSDQVHRMTGIGGFEYVVQKNIDSLLVGDSVIDNVPIQLGNMNSGFNINAILGTDVLLRINALIDYKTLNILTQ